MPIEKIRRRLVGTKIHEIMDAHPEFKEHGRRSMEALTTVKRLMEREIMPYETSADYGTDLGDIKDAIYYAQDKGAGRSRPVPPAKNRCP